MFTMQFFPKVTKSTVHCQRFQDCGNMAPYYCFHYLVQILLTMDIEAVEGFVPDFENW